MMIEQKHVTYKFTCLHQQAGNIPSAESRLASDDKRCHNADCMESRYRQCHLANTCVGKIQLLGVNAPGPAAKSTGKYTPANLTNSGFSETTTGGRAEQ